MRLRFKVIMIFIIFNFFWIVCDASILKVKFNNTFLTYTNVISYTIDENFVKIRTYDGFKREIIYLRTSLITWFGVTED